MPLFLFDAVFEYSPANPGEYWDISLNYVWDSHSYLPLQAKIRGVYKKNLYFARFTRMLPNNRGPPFSLNFSQNSD